MASSYVFRTSNLPKLDLNINRGTDFQAWHQQWLAYRSLSGVSAELAAKRQLCIQRDTRCCDLSSDKRISSNHCSPETPCQRSRQWTCGSFPTGCRMEPLTALGQMLEGPSYVFLKCLDKLGSCSTNFCPSLVGCRGKPVHDTWILAS